VGDLFPGLYAKRAGASGGSDGGGVSGCRGAARAIPGARRSAGPYGAAYRLTGYGRRFCLYTAEAPPYRDYPIVRHYSFFYYPGFPRDQEEDGKFNDEATYIVAADYFTLSRLLRARPQTRGLILDLRDNDGGNDPESFLDWYAPAPYEDQYIALRADSSWEDPAFTAKVGNVDAAFLAWYRRAAAGLEKGSWLKRPFKCLRPDCGGGNRFAPQHALLKVPVALLVGRGCHSSCAHFANIFDEYDFGPLIGEPTPATVTAQSYPHPIRTRLGVALGQLKLALSTSWSGKSGKPLEGALPFIDHPIPMTLENSAVLDHSEQRQKAPPPAMSDSGKTPSPATSGRGWG
jgi:hypothetical protein